MSLYPMKLYVIFPNYGGVGGITTVIKNIVTRLDKCRYDVIVLTGRDDISSDETNIPIVSFSHLFKIFPNLKFLLYIRTIEDSIIHIHGFHNLWSFGSLLLLKKSNRIVFNMHYIKYSPNFLRNLLIIPFRAIFRLLISRVDCIICVSNFERKLILKDFNIKPKKVFIIPNGFDKRTLKRYQWSYNPKNSQVLFVGRLAEVKNVDKLLEAMEILPDLTLTIVGTGPLEHHIKELINMKGLYERVDLKGSLNSDDVYREYSTSRVCVLPSLYESFGLVVGEAAIIGCPVIVTNNSALREFVESGLAYGIDPPINHSKIAEALSRIYTDSPRENALSFFRDWDEICGTYDKLFQEVIEFG